MLLSPVSVLISYALQRLRTTSTIPPITSVYISAAAVSPMKETAMTPSPMIALIHCFHIKRIVRFLIKSTFIKHLDTILPHA
jgi:hypothetical protein